MVNKNVKKELLLILSPKINIIGFEAVLHEMLKSGIVDERKCTIAVIKRWHGDRVVANMKAGERANVMQLIEDAAEYFKVSSCFVQNALYKNRGINL